MAKCLIFNIPAYGHVNPTIPLAKELISRGIEVIYYNTESFRDIYDKNDIPFRSYPGFNPTTTGPKKIDNMTLLKLYSKFADPLVQFTIKEIEKEKPDFIIKDNLAFWAKTASKVTNTPTTTSNTTVALNKEIIKKIPPKFDFFKLFFNIIPLIKIRSRFKKLQKKYDLPKENLFEMMIDNSSFNIVFTSRLFQPESESFGDNYKFVGPSIDTPYSEKKRNTIYISLGTIFNKNSKFFKQCFEAFKDLPYRVVISLGKGLEDSRLTDEAPDNFEIYSFTNQKELLQECVLFVTHGGMNGTSEGLYYETPLLVLPQMEEQRLNGRRAEELGAAILLDPNKLTTQQLKESALKILNDPTYKKNTSKVRESFIESGGYKKAVDEISNSFLQVAASTAR